MDVLIQWVKHFFENLIEMLKTVWYWVSDFVYNIFISVVYFIFDAGCLLIEGFFSLIDFKNDLFDMSLQWTSLPDQMIWILNQVGFDNGLLIITSAIGIRLLLNLIPTWATRV